MSKPTNSQLRAQRRAIEAEIAYTKRMTELNRIFTPKKIAVAIQLGIEAMRNEVLQR